MAQCITEQFGSSTCPQLRLTVTQSSQTATTATLSWVLDYVAHGYAVSSSNSRAYSAVINGTTVASGNFAFGGISSPTRIANGTVTINKTTSVKNISFSCSMAFNLTWGGVYGGTKSASGSISIGAKTSYKVTYNANGGSGAPGSQTKWHGTNITLSTVKPTRTGYSFQGWSTANDTSVEYASGATYSSNASVTLYAVWKANTYSVTYNANGGSGAPDDQTKTYGVTLTLSTIVPTRTNYDFKGWGTSESSTTVSYASGANYTANAAITLYAVWELAYTEPRIENLSVDRCDLSGTLNETGTYALVTFDWATDKDITSMEVAYKRTAITTWETISISRTGISGSESFTIGDNSLNSDYMYDIRVTISDSLGSYSRTTKLYSTKYILDFLSDGNGIAFGKAAERTGIADFGLEIYDKFGTRVNNGLAKYTGGGDSAIDPDTTSEELIVTDKNTPISAFMYIKTFFYGGKGTSDNRVQIAIPYLTAGSTYTRTFYDGTWTNWKKQISEDDLADHVVEQGTSGIWRYRKWSSGTAECWGAVKHAITFSGTWGNISTGPDLPAYSYPFTFTARPIETATLTNASGDYSAQCFLGISSNATQSTTKTATYKPMRSTAVTDKRYYWLNYYVMGYWK